MGRDLSWYVLPRNINHDFTKPLCFNLEYEPEEGEINDMIFRKFNPDIDMSMTLTFDERMALKDKVQFTSYDYLYDDDKNHKWCPKCKMFASGLHGSSLIIAEEHVGHSYSNPIWMSRWNVRGLYMGSSDTDFVHRFSSSRMYREINARELEATELRLQALGTPVRTSDKEALEETNNILTFIKNYINNEMYIVIMKYEH